MAPLGKLFVVCVNEALRSVEVGLTHAVSVLSADLYRHDIPKTSSIVLIPTHVVAGGPQKYFNLSIVV